MNIYTVTQTWKGYQTITVIEPNYNAMIQGECEILPTGKFGDSAIIYNLQVGEEYRGKEIGKALLFRMQSEILHTFKPKRIYLTVNTDAPRLIKWYEKRGFNVCGEPFIFRGTGEERVEMELCYKRFDDIRNT